MLSHNIRLSWRAGSGTDIAASSVLLSALQNHNPGCAAQAPKPSGRAPEYPSNEGSDAPCHRSTLNVLKLWDDFPEIATHHLEHLRCGAGARSMAVTVSLISERSASSGSASRV